MSPAIAKRSLTEVTARSPDSSISWYRRDPRRRVPEGGRGWAAACPEPVARDEERAIPRRRSAPPRDPLEAAIEAGQATLAAEADVGTIDRFRALTWDDVEDWAGARIVDRGKRYLAGGRVRDLGATSDGRVVAWVVGTQTYASGVSFDEDGELLGACTCPYWAVCKHAVATLLAYLESLRRGEDLAPLADDDRRLALLDDSDEDEADDEDEDDGEGDASGDAEEAPLGRWLRTLRAGELVDLLEDLADDVVGVYRALEHRRCMKRGEAADLLAVAADHVAAAAAAASGYGEWDDDDDEADYDALLEAADKAGVRDGVRAAVVRALETGERPGSAGAPWPLPPPPAGRHATRPLSPALAAHALVDIASHEDRPFVELLSEPACGADERTAWAVALQELLPAAADRLLAGWRHKHARRRNLWRDLAAVGLAR